MQEMRHQNASLNRLNSMVSHEMLTPILCIITYAKFVLKEMG